MIVGPWGDVLGECDGIRGSSPVAGEEESGGGQEPEICVGEVELGVLERVRREMPLLRRT